ncbi:MAG: BtpA/SgcQ family protein [Myxococcota bacterium]
MHQPDQDIPRLVGMVHLLPLPGAPRAREMTEVVARARADFAALRSAGFRAAMVENFGDSPFYPDRVPAETIAAMSAVITVLRADAPDMQLGVNVLRNDGESAIAIAAACGASFIRVNVLTGAMVTDQGVITARAHAVMRLRARLCPSVRVLADILVKHAEPLAAVRDLQQLVHDTVARAGADALVVSGEGTSRPVDGDRLKDVAAASPVPVYIGSGFSAQNAAAQLAVAHGAIVGSSIKTTSDPSSPVDPEKARALIAAVQRMC